MPCKCISAKFLILNIRSCLRLNIKDEPESSDGHKEWFFSYRINHSYMRKSVAPAVIYIFNQLPPEFL